LNLLWYLGKTCIQLKQFNTHAQNPYKLNYSFCNWKTLKKIPKFNPFWNLLTKVKKDITRKLKRKERVYRLLLNKSEKKIKLFKRWPTLSGNMRHKLCWKIVLIIFWLKIMTISKAVYRGLKMWTKNLILILDIHNRKLDNLLRNKIYSKKMLSP
jgi:hypothetical protein